MRQVVVIVVFVKIHMSYSSPKNADSKSTDLVDWIRLVPVSSTLVVCALGLALLILWKFACPILPQRKPTFSSNWPWDGGGFDAPGLSNNRINHSGAQMTSALRALVLVSRWLVSLDSARIIRYKRFLEDVTFGDIAALRAAVDPPPVDPELEQLE